MAYWRKCPECGETNYYQSASTQVFDCGFEGNAAIDWRLARCGGKGNKRPAAPAAPVTAAVPAVDSYRLAMLDAARAAELIAEDMREADAEDEFAGRVASLAAQLRGFAGHGDGGVPPLRGQVSPRPASPGTGLMRWLGRRD